MLLIQYLLGRVVTADILHPYIIWIVGFYWLVSISLHVLSHLAERHLEMDLTLILLAGVTSRLLIAIAAMVIVVLIGVVDKSLFIINFAVVYLCYLVFEITSVLSNLRSNLK
ncbi:hypothetical protein N6H18_07340 [Reichenbachiella agarivorans]|uniref:Uncharacterized protein n=1 Tax=Reichenbachiella agarivorans TaxID=2979464 RepID=A0ABY6CTD6_9BACT|nr:hypothetical protein [Reichenbachiella agarivorans]UXP33766.1 hypothetical protein N6H18_07340 [Reichenbachiella agarivorans]